MANVEPAAGEPPTGQITAINDWYLVVEAALGTPRIIGPFDARQAALDYGSRWFPLHIVKAGQIELKQPG